MSLAVSCGSVVSADAQEAAKFLLYAGAGQAIDSENLTDDNIPYAIGGLVMSPASGLVLGADIAGEGEMFDSTGGGNRIRQALSYNLLIGGNVYDDQSIRADAMLLLGARESVSDCPDSYLGFQCYADTDPDTQYDFNYGAMFAVTFGEAASLGVRMTGESAQLTLGFMF
ncbi:hypothetical protein LOM8899_02966 [Flavimaricola marinus]|uniref:Outer membrane protein beta-barrel domain-containing protein n=1 Tax=Flavimaricola marinus TaxID=1819565 RepID=A0A238LGR4_9RHOB|nr:hypothetical protein LOM8899_02966 [Flavimaricola marinus]